MTRPLPLVDDERPLAAVPPAEEQLAHLAVCGISLRPGANVTAFIGDARPSLEGVPYLPLLHRLGSRDDAGQWWCDGVWCCDTEELQQPGGLQVLAERFRDLARGDLPLSGIREGLDEATGVAWIAYKLDGQAARWEAELSGEWSDLVPAFYIAEELEQRETDRRFIHLDHDGRYVLFGCATRQEARALVELTGLEWDWFVE